MKTKDLTKAINDSEFGKFFENCNDFFKGIKYGIMGLLIIFLGFLIIGIYQNYEECGKLDCGFESVSYYEPCINYQVLECYIENEDNEIYHDLGNNCEYDEEGEQISACGGGGWIEQDIRAEHKNICGYQEANSWFEMIKQQNKDENLTMRCY